MRVAERVATIPDATDEIVAAAWLHDVVEDCGITTGEIESEFSPIVANLVRELTNPSKARRELSRADRKQIDRDHLAGVSRWATIIKLVDRIDNVAGMCA